MLPLEAENEILEQLYWNYEISSDEAAEIAKKYGVKGSPEKLQSAYRKKLVRRFLGTLQMRRGAEKSCLSQMVGVERSMCWLPCAMTGKY